MKEIQPIVRGLIKLLPGISIFLKNNPGGGYNARYYYSVLLRHMVQLQNTGVQKMPEDILELGPGSTLGVGICALLLGAKRYYALDAIKHWDVESNLEILNSLIELLKTPEEIPREEEFPNIKPVVSTHQFPHHLLLGLPDERRISQIRRSIMQLRKSHTSDLIEFIRFNTKDNVPKNIQVDLIISQAVLEHVENLDQMYSYMKKCLKLNGIMSHIIDFKSHGITKSWNGHWLYSDFEWKIIKGYKKYIINRSTYTDHVNFLNRYNFQVIKLDPVVSKSIIKIKNLPLKYNKYPIEDFSTSGLFIIAKSSHV